MTSRLVLALMCGITVGCPGPNSPDDDAGVLMIEDGGMALDLSKGGLAAFVKERKYTGWKAEPAVHQSTGPHGGNVRTYANDALYDALKNSTGDFPSGSVTVKELYASDGVTITGHAVDAKQNGEWVFYEGFTSDDYKAPYYFRGTGNLCSNCHSSGRDFFLTPAASFP